MTTTSQLFVRDRAGDDWKWLLASGAAIASFAALLAGSVIAVIAFLVIYALVVALDQRSTRA